MPEIYYRHKNPDISVNVCVLRHKNIKHGFNQNVLILKGDERVKEN